MLSFSIRNDINTIYDGLWRAKPNFRTRRDEFVILFCDLEST